MTHPPSVFKEFNMENSSQVLLINAQDYIIRNCNQHNKSRSLGCLLFKMLSKDTIEATVASYQSDNNYRIIYKQTGVHCYTAIRLLTSTKYLGPVDNLRSGHPIKFTLRTDDARLRNWRKPKSYISHRPWVKAHV